MTNSLVPARRGVSDDRPRSAGRPDPRPARSRARLLDAATALLRSGGPSAVTIDAVTRSANVARATLYRHFPSGNDLLAAAFMSLMPPAPMPPDEGGLRDRLITVVEALDRGDRRGACDAHRNDLAGLGPRCRATIPSAPSRSTATRSTLRERIVQHYSVPFDAIFDSPQAAAELGSSTA